jgi:hypothetical protein
MADLIANLKLILSYQAPGGGTVSVPAISINAPFQASVVGFLDVPDATIAETPVAVPFGSIADGATLVVLQNQTGQELDITINGQTSDVAFSDEGVAVIAAASLPDGTPLTALGVITTAPQAGPGKVGYFVFGDPEPPV